MLLDPACIYDSEGKVLPIREWPLEARLALEAMTPNRYGTRFEFSSKIRAAEIRLKAAGRRGSASQVEASPSRYSAFESTSVLTSPATTPVPPTLLRKAGPRRFERSLTGQTRCQSIHTRNTTQYLCDRDNLGTQASIVLGSIYPRRVKRSPNESTATTRCGLVEKTQYEELQLGRSIVSVPVDGVFVRDPDLPFL